MFTKVIVVVLFSYVQYATSIRCFECNSMNNSMCLNPTQYDPETLYNFLRSTECRHGVLAVAPEGNYDFFCRKIEQTILHKNYAPEVRVTRGCGWKRHYRECYTADNEDHLETVCQCYTDDCNAAVRLSATATHALAVLAAAAVRLTLF